MYLFCSAPNKVSFFSQPNMRCIRACHLTLIHLSTNQKVQLIHGTLSANQNKMDHRNWNFHVIFTLTLSPYLVSLSLLSTFHSTRECRVFPVTCDKHIGSAFNEKVTLCDYYTLQQGADKQVLLTLNV